MAHPAFDTQEVVEILTKGGFNAQQAKSINKVLLKTISDNMVTQSDLFRVESEIKSEIKSAVNSFESKLESLMFINRSILASILVSILGALIIKVFIH